jgi:NAD-dependent deacetylase
MEKIKELANLIRESQRIVVFTGAGVSTESGIPDFRSPGGLWSKYDPSEFYFQRFLSDENARRTYWKMYREFYATLHRAEPNEAHHACKRLWEMGKLLAVVTQNVDGLHQKAGVPEELVLELHGNAWRVKCLSCGNSYPSQEIERWLNEGVEIPLCEKCNGLLKPATVSFGQSLPPDVLRKAEKCARECDLMIAVGSSLVVFPAAMIPIMAKDAGARLVIVNLDPTPYDDRADLVIRGSAGVILMSAVKEAEIM